MIKINRLRIFLKQDNKSNESEINKTTLYRNKKVMRTRGMHHFFCGLNLENIIKRFCHCRVRIDVVS